MTEDVLGTHHISKDDQKQLCMLFPVNTQTNALLFELILIRKHNFWHSVQLCDCNKECKGSKLFSIHALSRVKSTRNTPQRLQMQ